MFWQAHKCDFTSFNLDHNYVLEMAQSKPRLIKKMWQDVKLFHLHPILLTLSYFAEKKKIAKMLVARFAQL